MDYNKEVKLRGLRDKSATLLLQLKSIVLLRTYVFFTAFSIHFLLHTLSSTSWMRKCSYERKILSSDILPKYSAGNFNWNSSYFKLILYWGLNKSFSFSSDVFAVSYWIATVTLHLTQYSSLCAHRCSWHVNLFLCNHLPSFLAVFRDGRRRRIEQRQGWRGMDVIWCNMYLKNSECVHDMIDIRLSVISSPCDSCLVSIAS